jgi:uncharacterized protein YdaU (DUF1376 family)
MPQDGAEIKGDHTPFWMFYTSDWAGAVIGFTLEQRGFYFECLRRMWERKGGLVDDVKWLAAAISCDPRTVRRLRSFLINQGKLQPINGLLINGRAMRDIAKWKRQAAAKLRGSSGEDQPKLALNFPENPTNSKVVPFPQGGISSHHQNHKESEKVESSGTTIDDDPPKPRRRVSPSIRKALTNRVGEERATELIAEYEGSEYATNAKVLDRAFVGWLNHTYQIGISARGDAMSREELLAACGGNTKLPTAAQMAARKGGRR